MAIISEVSGTSGSELPDTWISACTGVTARLPPSSSNYLDSVLDSSVRYIKSQAQPPLVAVNSERVKEYVDGLDIKKFDKYVKHVNSWSRNLPLVFDNVAQEMNLIALVDLLQFGSGYRDELHKYCDRGASDTINFGCISLHISQTPIDAEGLQSLTLGDVSQHFGIPLFGDERPMQKGNTAVMISEASELRPLAEIILGTLHDTGRRLKQAGFVSLADFIIKVCAEQATASHLVSKLVGALPSLRDAVEIDGQPVYLFKKAQLMAYDICQRFGKNDSKFAFPDIDRMTLFADNVVPAMVQHHGLITPCQEIASKIESGKELSLKESTAMRAASIVAAQEVVDYANKNVSTSFKADDVALCQATIDNYWWQEGKEPELRKIKRLVYKQTVYF
ncbi:hypothetical protein LPJ73_001430 [Coemansia sp. RSA 2703]|nr:hypothetical protein LPJ73_001430 [Coemansia sp. RSA 2703]KAJ2374965.1 hypothetical protein IW150_002808 [Coemansia sp. RSA 2607]KAJ2396834.1 hypothetical protein GGI05_000943 [Coemansia sp. RSA 2603]